MPEITRADAAVILSEQSANDIVDIATETSVVLGAFPTQRMSKKVFRQPILSQLPDAYFVAESSTDPAGIKPTTDMAWADKTFTAEEIAVIVPIHENLLADADIDIWAAVRPKVAEAFALRLDRAVLYGEQAPASWVDANIVGKAIASGNNIARGSQRDLAEDFNQVFARLEDDGFDPNTAFAVRSLKSRFRGLRDSAGHPIYLDEFRNDNNTATIYGQPLRYLHTRVAAPATAEAVLGDRSAAVVGIREDMQVKFLDQATLTGAGGTLINLAERDMVALRFKFRVAFATIFSPLARPAGAYPFSVLTPPPPPTV